MTTITHDVPEHSLGGLVNFVVWGTPTGGFLEAVISNDLKGAFMRADEENRAALFHIVSFLYNHMPGGSQGSPEHYATWIRIGGLVGFTDPQTALAWAEREALLSLVDRRERLLELIESRAT